jgi:hypothetical protein
MVVELDVILKSDLFGLWTSAGEFVCGDCASSLEGLEFYQEDVLTLQQVEHSAAFYYCSACGERVQPDQH